MVYLYSMMKKVVVAALSVSLIIGGISPVAAQENSVVSEGLSSSGSSASDRTNAESNDTESEAAGGQSSSEDPTNVELSATPVGSTDLKTVIGAIVGTLAVGALIAAGLNWAVQSRIIPNPFPGLIPNPPAPPAPVKKAPAKPAPKPAPAKKPAPKPAPAQKPVVAKPAPVKRPAPAKRPAPVRPQNVYYANCKDVWNRLGRPIYQRDAGFSGRFDRDGDGVGCEKRPNY